MAGSMDDADPRVWDKRDCGVCGRLADLWARVHVYSERAEGSNDELARSRTGMARSSWTRRGECIASLFVISSDHLLDFVMAFMAKEHLFEDLKREGPGHDFPEHMEEFVIALQTGMRCKEQYSRIDWSCVDLVRKDIRVPQSKNGKGRHIPLSDAARVAFERLRQRKFGEGAVPIRAEGPIFTGRDGERLLGAKHWFLRAVKKAGLTDFTWHDLRHSFASRLVMADVDIRTVADLLGHRTLTMTMRYTHLAPEHKQVAVERLSRYNLQGS
jgi:hypothetical protein